MGYLAGNAIIRDVIAPLPWFDRRMKRKNRRKRRANVVWEHVEGSDIREVLRRVYEVILRDDPEKPLAENFVSWARGT
jgi:hypothetical protein